MFVTVEIHDKRKVKYDFLEFKDDSLKVESIKQELSLFKSKISKVQEEITDLSDIFNSCERCFNIYISFLSSVNIESKSAYICDKCSNSKQDISVCICDKHSEFMQNTSITTYSKYRYSKLVQNESVNIYSEHRYSKLVNRIDHYSKKIEKCI